MARPVCRGGWRKRRTVDEKTSIVASLNGQTLRLEGIQQTAKPASHGPDQIYKAHPLLPRMISLFSPSPCRAALTRRRRKTGCGAVMRCFRPWPIWTRNRKMSNISATFADRLSDRGLQKRVSFEWWSLPGHKKVLLLWVDESSLSGYPAEKLNELLSQASQEKPPEVKLSRFTVIGPNTSTLLRDMMKEVKDAKQGNPVANSVGNPHSSRFWEKLTGIKLCTSPPGQLHPMRPCWKAYCMQRTVKQ